MEIERAAFSHPWSEELVRRELGHDFSTVLVATAGEGGPILGFAIVWTVHDELHVLNVAVAPEARRRGVARAMIDDLLVRAQALGADEITLEVRTSNFAAQALYRGYGFRLAGLRRGYYRDTGEDALVMARRASTAGPVPAGSGLGAASGSSAGPSTTTDPG
jgi:ribosomal-protein-alanine N-acetyltransferase